jgi:phosphate transport system ATP-binding protein
MFTQATSLSGRSTAPEVQPDIVMHCDIDRLFYGTFCAVRDTHIPIDAHQITALIGPSGCGKSTVLRCLNRTNDFVRGFRLEGAVRYHGMNIYDHAIDPVSVRRYIGMVFQQPNPFSMSIYDNVAFGLRIHGLGADCAERVEQALRSAALWDEVKDKLQQNALSLSGGQQQRLCIARAIAIEPEVLLMDEPCAALDPIATRKIEQLMLELKQKYTLVIVTHNLQQAARVSDLTAFMNVNVAQDTRTGYLVEMGNTRSLFSAPREPATCDYLQGRFG